MVYAGVYSVANLAAFNGPCRQSVAALRAASANPYKSVPAMPKRFSGTDFLLSEMKEYDA